jgi:hypothetical protein
MTGRIDVERVLDAFLAPEADQLPDRVLEASLSDVARTPQRRAVRVPWRFFPMTGFARAAIAALVVVVTGGSLYLFTRSTNVGPQSTPTPSPTAGLPVPPLNAKFTSPLYGYSVRYPDGWSVTPAAHRWTSDEEILWGSEALDDLHGSDVRFVAASRPLHGMAAQDWIDQTSGTAPVCVGSSPLPATLPVGGEVGTVTLNGCKAAGGGIAPGGLVYDVLVVSGDSGYDLTVDGAVDAGYVEAILATVTFPAPVDTTGWTPFVSDRLGISLKFPPGWNVTPATEPWIWQKADPGPTEAGTDRAVGPQNQGFVVASQRLPIGMTEDAWWADYLSADTTGLPAGCFPATRPEYEPVEIAGHAGFLHGGTQGCNFTEAIVIVDRRAYQLTAYANVSVPSGGIFDRTTFDAWLATVTFDAAAADDSPASTPGAN